MGENNRELEREEKREVLLADENTIFSPMSTQDIYYGLLGTSLQVGLFTQLWPHGKAALVLY